MDSIPVCDAGNEYDGRMGTRISAVFVILVGSTLGATFPVIAERHRSIGISKWAFFIVKYFGSGIIIATAFIHLLAPAIEALGNPCLTGPITEYPWVAAITLMTIFVLFFVELMAMRYSTFGQPEGHSHSHSHNPESGLGTPSTKPEIQKSPRSSSYTPGEDHLGHTRNHTDAPNPTTQTASSPAYYHVGDTLHDQEDYAPQMTAILILEFGVIFHSIFVGLTLAVAGEEFITLYVVLVFHQTFEGLGLGSRLAVTPWPANKRSTPYWFALAYGLSTPIAMAVGLGLRQTYSPGSSTALVVNGVFDSVSAGILIYTGLVELMAHEFIFSSVMRRASLEVVMGAFGMMCLGAGLMALLGKWA